MGWSAWKATPDERFYADAVGSTGFNGVVGSVTTQHTTLPYSDIVGLAVQRGLAHDFDDIMPGRRPRTWYGGGPFYGGAQIGIVAPLWSNTVCTYTAYQTVVVQDVSDFVTAMTTTPQPRFADTATRQWESDHYTFLGWEFSDPCTVNDAARSDPRSTSYPNSNRPELTPHPAQSTLGQFRAAVLDYDTYAPLATTAPTSLLPYGAGTTLPTQCEWVSGEPGQPGVNTITLDLSSLGTGTRICLLFEPDEQRVAEWGPLTDFTASLDPAGQFRGPDGRDYFSNEYLYWGWHIGEGLRQGWVYSPEDEWGDYFGYPPTRLHFRCPRYRTLLETPALRLSQRNDGLGSARSPRLTASTDTGSSVQSTRTPRVGPSDNRYR